MHNNCIFCNNLLNRCNSITDLLPDIKNDRLVFHETENLLLTIDLYPIVNDPYFLIVARDHIKSFKQLHTKVDLEITEMFLFIKSRFDQSVLN